MNTLQNNDNGTFYESHILIASYDRKNIEEFILRARSPEHGIHMQIDDGSTNKTGARVRCITPNKVVFDVLVSRANWAFVFGAKEG